VRVRASKNGGVQVSAAEDLGVCEALIGHRLAGGVNFAADGCRVTFLDALQQVAPACARVGQLQDSPKQIQGVSCPSRRRLICTRMVSESCIARTIQASMSGLNRLDMLACLYAFVAGVQRQAGLRCCWCNC
jgi:hypothetical protein